MTDHYPHPRLVSDAANPTLRECDLCGTMTPIKNLHQEDQALICAGCCQTCREKKHGSS
jgi:hypothetical protein